MFVVVEGIDGSGKTTVVNELKIQLPEATFLRFPSSEVIRNTLLTEGPLWSANAVPYLFAADSVNESDTTIKKALTDGKTVVADRYFASLLVYQNKHMHGMFSAELLRHLVIPDIMVFLHCPYETYMERASFKDHLETKDRTVFEDRLSKYWDFTKQSIACKHLVLEFDTSLPENTPYAIASHVVAVVGGKL